MMSRSANHSKRCWQKVDRTCSGRGRARRAQNKCQNGHTATQSELRTPSQHRGWQIHPPVRFSDLYIFKSASASYLLAWRLASSPSATNPTRANSPSPISPIWPPSSQPPTPPPNTSHPTVGPTRLSNSIPSCNGLRRRIKTAVPAKI